MIRSTQQCDEAVASNCLKGTIRIDGKQFAVEEGRARSNDARTRGEGGSAGGSGRMEQRDEWADVRIRNQMSRVYGVTSVAATVKLMTVTSSRLKQKRRLGEIRAA